MLGGYAPELGWEIALATTAYFGSNRRGAEAQRNAAEESWCS